MSTGVDGWQFEVVHSLSKIYPDRAAGIDAVPQAISVFLGETGSFQIAVRPPRTAHFRDNSPLQVHVNPAAAPHVRLHTVELVPCDLAAYPGHDDGYDRDQPGLYPDLIRPLTDGTIAPLLGSWRGVWVDFRVDDPALAGINHVEVTISDSTSTLLFATTVTVTVIGLTLPALDISHTQWFHCDGLAQFYGLEVFSEEHWRLIDNFLGSAARLQVNTILTPVWTPPLDTEVGGHRLPTQLLGFTYDDDAYRVDFALLDRWMELCRGHGIERLEIAHLFSQWGAHFTPFIYVTRGGELVEEFGWHVGATDPSYRRFLEQVLPVLIAHLATHWGLERVLFHISDEPDGPDQVAGYLSAQAVVQDLLSSCTVIDALSDVDLYDSGAVPLPVIATDSISPFLERGLSRPWVYYCVAQNRDVSNKFFALPSSRNRVIGHQLFAYDCAGFLNWGFNFYNSELSRRPINPFLDTTASGGILGGDAFLVYPGEDGQPLESIRHRVLTQAMYDLRAFQELSRLAGREAVMKLLDTDGHGGPLRFDSYSTDPLHYLRVREAVNHQIQSAAG